MRAYINIAMLIGVLAALYSVLTHTERACMHAYARHAYTICEGEYLCLVGASSLSYHATRCMQRTFWRSPESTADECMKEALAFYEKGANHD